MYNTRQTDYINYIREIIINMVIKLINSKVKNVKHKYKRL